MLRGICSKLEILLKTRSYGHKVFKKNILENRTRQMLLMAVLMVDLWLKLLMEVVDENDFIFTCLVSIYRGTYWTQPDMIKLFARIVEVFKITLLNVSQAPS